VDGKRNTVHPESQTKSQFHVVTDAQKSREKSCECRTNLAIITINLRLRYDLCREKENREISGGGVPPPLASPPGRAHPEHATSSSRARSIHPSACVPAAGSQEACSLVAGAGYLQSGGLEVVIPSVARPFRWYKHGRRTLEQRFLARPGVQRAPMLLSLPAAWSRCMRAGGRRRFRVFRRQACCIGFHPSLAWCRQKGCYRARGAWGNRDGLASRRYNRRRRRAETGVHKQERKRINLLEQ
jgi:hypothetical protein